MRVCMIGGGYVGLVSGACFASLGANVTIIESDEARIKALRQGQMPIYEPGLAELVAQNRAEGRLEFSPHIHAVAGADIVFLAVGTPSRRGDGHADLTYVFNAAAQVAEALTGPVVLVTKSTVPVGTGARLAALMAERRPELEINVASNPEFLREGSAIGDFMEPDRIVIGTASAEAANMLAALYGPLTCQGVRLLMTGIETAELIKYAANSFLALKITFINEMADLCERVGAGIDELAQGMGMDQRIGAAFLRAGPGFGGSCFPKDTQALARIAQEADAPSRLVETVVAVNESRKAAMAGRIMKACGGSVRRLKIAVLGLTFKPDTDDMRDAPAIGIIHRLSDEGAMITAHDPAGMAQARPLLPETTRFCASAEAAMAGADAVVILTEWGVYKTINPTDMRALMRGRVVVDLRNALDGAAMRAAGLDYTGIGRPGGRPEPGRQIAPPALREVVPQTVQHAVPLAVPQTVQQVVPQAGKRAQKCAVTPMPAPKAALPPVRPLST